MNFIPKNFKGEIFTNDIFIEETLKSLSIGEIGNITDFNYAGFSINIQIKTSIDIETNFDNKFNLKKCSKYTKNKNEINQNFQLHDFYYFLLFANSVIDIFVLIFIPIKDLYQTNRKYGKDKKGKSYAFNLIFLTYFPKVTSCFLMGNSIIEVYNGCVILQDSFYLYQIIFIIYISLSLYSFIVIIISLIYSILKKFLDNERLINNLSKALIFFANIPSLFLNYILFSTYLKNDSKETHFLASFFFPYFICGFITTNFLWIIWLKGSTENQITAILQISTFAWTIFSHLFYEKKKKIFQYLSSSFGSQTKKKEGKNNENEKEYISKIKKKHFHSNKIVKENNSILQIKEQQKSINSYYGDIINISEFIIEPLDRKYHFNNNFKTIKSLYTIKKYLEEKNKEKGKKKGKKFFNSYNGEITNSFEIKIEAFDRKNFFNDAFKTIKSFNSIEKIEIVVNDSELEIEFEQTPKNILNSEYTNK